jgi:hypothetical protein
MTCLVNQTGALMMWSLSGYRLLRLEAIMTIQLNKKKKEKKKKKGNYAFMTRP